MIPGLIILAGITASIVSALFLGSEGRPSQSGEYAIAVAATSIGWGLVISFTGIVRKLLLNVPLSVTGMKGWVSSIMIALLAPSLALLLVGNVAAIPLALVIWIFIASVGLLCSLGIALLCYVFLVALKGSITFIKLGINHRDNGLQATALIFFGISLIGLMLLLISLYGTALYSSPKRWDIAPMLGIVREGVVIRQQAAFEFASWLFRVGLGMMLLSPIGAALLSRSRKSK